MENDEKVRALKAIEEALASDPEYPVDGTLLYAEVAEGMASPAVFKDRGNHVLYRRVSARKFAELLFDLWYLEEPAKRWAEMEYLIRDGRFEATFTYRNQIDPEEDDFDRRKRIVARYFGDKPIVYPPWPKDEGDSFYFDL